MQPLATYAQYVTYTNATSGTNQTLIENLLSAATVSIQDYCNREFFSDLYIQWFVKPNNFFVSSNTYNKTIPRNYPIKNIVLVGEKTEALSVTNNNTTPYNISIHNDKLTVTDNLDYTTYSLSGTLNDVAGILSGSYSMAVTIDDDAFDNAKLLTPTSYNILAGESKDVYGTKQINTTAKIASEEILAYNGYDVIAYVAGYDDIPLDLQFTTCNIARDMLNTQLNAKQNLKSESITNYSYTLADGVSWLTIINNYSEQLAPYRNVVF